ncbi:MAG TPA: hypothetical protein EYN64_00700, partial [Flavobacteriales bacterium]|nr:hypothetical protein [Flavobacteriales bacterium]
MQKILSVTLVSLIIFSCGESKTEKKTVENTTLKEVPNSVQPEETRVAAGTELNRFCGYYVGLFKAVTFGEGKRPSYANKINISIDSLRGEILYGHSVVAGNLRPFQGPFNYDGEKIYATAKEPGDDQYDGAFTFQIGKSKIVLSGTWEANDKNLAVTKRKYTLSSKQFKYDPATPLP